MTWDRAILYNSPGEPEHQEGQKNLFTRSIESIIGFCEEEHPIVLQLGGSNPEPLARAARIGAARGYDEINLNCGCPAQTRGRSRNNYGARLMKEPEVVASCCAAMRTALDDAGHADVAVTVKCRLGVDSRDSYEELVQFVRTVAAAGVQHFIVHARKAILGLNTTQNRSVPPLRHEWVRRLMADFPHLTFTLNGGVGSGVEGGHCDAIDQAAALLQSGFAGVMLGRRANAEPYLFARAGALFSLEAGPSRREVLDKYLAYCARAERANWDDNSVEGCARALITPLTGLLHNTVGGPRWRQALTKLMQDRAALQSGEGVPALVRRCLGALSLPDGLLDERPSLRLCPPPKAHSAARATSERDAPTVDSPGGVAIADADGDGESECCGGGRGGGRGDAADSLSLELLPGGVATSAIPQQAVRRRDGKGDELMDALDEQAKSSHRRRQAVCIALGALCGAVALTAILRQRRIPMQAVAAARS